MIPDKPFSGELMRLRPSTQPDGIETAAQEAALLAMGRRIGQGYLYSKAIPPEEFAALVKSRENGVLKGN